MIFSCTFIVSKGSYEIIPESDFSFKEKKMLWKLIRFCN